MTRALMLFGAFVSGAAVMSLEMAGFRLVQPELGSDIIVWGSLISVFLGGLALGAWTGGWLADRNATLWKLGLMLALSGAVAMTIPLYADAVLEWTIRGHEAPLPMEWTGGAAASRVYEPPDLRWQALGAGALLFALPAFLLGMVTPYTVRLLVRAMPSLGAGVGAVSAISTLGAIIGTLGTAFYLITVCSTRQIFGANGLLLLALGGALLLAGATRRVEATAKPGP